jgi:hypothetical protein
MSRIALVVDDDPAVLELRRSASFFFSKHRIDYGSPDIRVMRRCSMRARDCHYIIAHVHSATKRRNAAGDHAGITGSDS